MTPARFQNIKAWLLFACLAVLAMAIYGTGLRGGFIFDDYPNIVDNAGLKPADATLPSLVRSALSSPSSEFKRPLASLTFAVNFLATGDDPGPMKATNVVIHVLNGLVVFLLARRLLRFATQGDPNDRQWWVAALLAGTWLLLPINLTSVLYVVQRMESIANLLVLLGLLAYVHARERMQVSPSPRWPLYAAAGVIACTCIGLLAKEMAAMLPVYALATEATLFHFRSLRKNAAAPTRDHRLFAAYAIFLLLPAVAGLCWLLPGLLAPAGWATRNFTMGTRLLTELRVVPAYAAWTLLPLQDALSFYHDNWTVSTGLLSPWTTLAGALAIVAGAYAAWVARHRFPLVTLGLLFFGSAQLLTGTILPLELVYEHRNYFASMGLLLAVIPVLAASRGTLPGPLVRYVLLALLVAQSTILLYTTARAWDNPLSLAQELAARAPDSPRAQYELGRTYIILSKYDPASPFTSRAYAPLELAMRLNGSSILPEQALVFLNARLHRPVEDAWWASMTHKLSANSVTVQDESSLGALNDCMQRGLCDLPPDRMTAAYLAALSHPAPSARLLSMYGDFAWSTLHDRDLGLRMSIAAMQGAPREPVYRITVIRMLVAQGRMDDARTELTTLARMNVGGSLDDSLDELRRQITP
ncbi:hypothetical protein [Luteibacter yeojuensis]|uniref:Tetratricopeptide repeat protein n=1 Tax=Luteibacter yeojuensis TaxID=345309 RepID=A0A0F3KIU5_9GAMM|nr:hypothetical protein [Luteibacter yeojuensis]KJV30927.1 hypothetical protein VI08_14370 [Luteibacter yeojuensis]